MTVVFGAAKEAAFTPLNCTADTVAKLPPESVTTVPRTPLAGANPVMSGGLEVTTKLLLVVKLVVLDVTVMGPVGAPAGTLAVICVPPPPVRVKVAATPPNLTLDALARLSPSIYTAVLIGPFEGEKLVIMGPVLLVKLVLVVKLPCGVKTSIGPVPEALEHQR